MSTNTPGPGVDWGRGARYLGRAGAMAAGGAALGTAGGPLGMLATGSIGFLLGLVSAADQDRIEQEAQAAEQRAIGAGATAEEAAKEAKRVREDRLAELIPDAKQRLAAMEAGRASAWDELTQAQAGQVGAYDALTNPYDELVNGLTSRVNPYGQATLDARLGQTSSAIAARFGQGEDALRARLAQRQLGAGAEAAAYSALASQRALQQTQNELATRAEFGQQATAWDELAQDRLGEARRLQAEAGNRTTLGRADLAAQNAAARLNYATGQQQQALGRLDALSGQQEAGLMGDAGFYQGREAQQAQIGLQRRQQAQQGDQALGQLVGGALGRVSPTELGGVFGGLMDPQQPTVPRVQPQQAGTLPRRQKATMGQGYQTDLYQSPWG